MLGQAMQIAAPVTIWSVNPSAEPMAADTSSMDDELVARTRAGDREAFEGLVLRYRRLITRVAGRFFPRIEDAEDIAQETFFKAFLNIEKLKAGVPVRNWLMRIAVNLCLDRLRRLKSRPEKSMSEVSTEDESWLDRHSRAIAEEHLASDAGHRDAEELLRMILPRIPEKEQALLHLLYGEGMSVSEVAEIMGWSEVNVRVRAYRTRRALKQAFDELQVQRRN